MEAEFVAGCWRTKRGVMVRLSAETVRLAERLAAVQRVPVEEAIQEAIEQYALASGVIGPLRDTSPQAIARRKALTQQIIDEIKAQPVLDPRPWQEILGGLQP